MEPGIKKQLNAGNVYYTLYWSTLKKPDKFDIVRSVPSVSGIFELYYQDRHHRLNLFFVSKAWYGGLRNRIRTATDAELEPNARRKKILQTYTCWYRYTIEHSSADLADIFFFFASTYFPHNHRVEHSGRYADIFVNEISPDKIVSR